MTYHWMSRLLSKASTASWVRVEARPPRQCDVTEVNTVAEVPELEHDCRPAGASKIVAALQQMCEQ